MPPCIRVAKDALDATILRLCATLPEAIISVSGQLLRQSKRSMAGQGDGGVMACTNSLPMAVSAVVLKLTRRGCCGSNIIIVGKQVGSYIHTFATLCATAIVIPVFRVGYSMVLSHGMPQDSYLPYGLYTFLFRHE